MEELISSLRTAADELREGVKAMETGWKDEAGNRMILRLLSAAEDVQDDILEVEEYYRKMCAGHSGQAISRQRKTQGMFVLTETMIQ